MGSVRIPATQSGVATNLRNRGWFSNRGNENSKPTAGGWFRLQFHGPFLSAILVISALFIVLTPLLANDALDYGKYVGIYLFLLSMTVLLPLAFKANTARGLLAFPAAPFVGLNFLYFVLGTLVPLACPDASFPTISLPAVPLAILILALGFAFLGAGILMSHGRLERWLPKCRDLVTVRGMEMLVVVMAVAIWVMRIYFATQGYGITHAAGGGLLLLPQQLQPFAVLLSEIQYVPVCLCITRLCNAALPSPKVRAWQIGLAIILTADILYFTMIGSRLSLVWELLILSWAMWLRLIPGFSRRWYAYACLLIVVALPVIYAQRAALRILAPKAGENHLELTRDLIPEQARLLEDPSWADVGGRFNTEVGRFAGVAPISAVSDRIFNEGYPLMWGETLKEGLPFLAPRAMWPSKPDQVNVDFIIENNFDLPEIDDLTLIQTECLANFGIAGLCLSMFLFGILIEMFFRYLIKVAAFSEPRTTCLLVMLPVVFNVETDITSVLAALRILPVLYGVLMLLSVRGRPTKARFPARSAMPRSAFVRRPTAVGSAV